MVDVRAKILSNEKICADYYKMVLDAPSIARSARPGQFVQVRCRDGTEPLLRRPFSIHRVSGIGYRVSSVEILYEVVGRGTEILAKKKAGDFVDALGPLGSGFTLSRTPNPEPRTTILIAGGIGVAPLIFLAEKLMEIKNHPSTSLGTGKSKIKIVVLIGARTKNLILCEKDFKKVGAEVRIATDDGSNGHKGFVSKLFEEILRSTNHEPRTTIYACGPHAMLNSIADICEERGLDCEVSLEERMACGFGACLGCAVKIKGEAGYKLACKDGPVFDAAQLIW